MKGAECHWRFLVVHGGPWRTLMVAAKPRKMLKFPDGRWKWLNSPRKMLKVTGG